LRKKVGLLLLSWGGGGGLAERNSSDSCPGNSAVGISKFQGGNLKGENKPSVLSSFEKRGRGNNVYGPT